MRTQTSPPRTPTRHAKLKVFGTWKNALTCSQSVELATTLAAYLQTRPVPFDLFLCPPMIALESVQRLSTGAFRLTAQNMTWDDAVTHTGETSAKALREIGCRYVMLGHSERRSHLGETDLHVARKVATAVQNGLVPLICVGETREELDAGRTQQVIAAQINTFLPAIESIDDPKQLMIAYEPAWAITTSVSPVPPDPKAAQGNHEQIRELVARERGSDFARGVAIVYGAGVNVSNVADFLRQPDIDGVLVGGASQEARRFIELLEIIRGEVRRQSMQPAFVQPLLDDIAGRSAAIAQIVDGILESVSPDVACSISSASLAGAIDGGVIPAKVFDTGSNIAGASLSGDITGVRYFASRLSASTFDAERRFDCALYVRSGGVYHRPRQFMELDSPVRLLGIGSRPELALAHVIDEMKSFDPLSLDEDGFVIAGTRD